MSFHSAVNSGILVRQTYKKQLIQDDNKVIDFSVMISNNITQLTVIKVDDKLRLHVLNCPSSLIRHGCLVLI